jgi:hypothetical protein
MIQLDHPSAAVKNRGDTALRDDLLEILRLTRFANSLVVTPSPDQQALAGDAKI